MTPDCVYTDIGGVLDREDCRTIENNKLVLAGAIDDGYQLLTVASSLVSWLQAEKSGQ